MAGVPGPRLGAGGRGDARQDRGRPSQCHRSLAGDCLRPRVSLRRRAPAAGVGAIATRRGGGRVMAGPLKIAALSLSAAALAAGLATACRAEERKPHAEKDDGQARTDMSPCLARLTVTTPPGPPHPAQDAHAVAEADADKG